MSRPPGKLHGVLVRTAFEHDGASISNLFAKPPRDDRLPPALDQPPFEQSVQFGLLHGRRKKIPLTDGAAQ